MARYTIREFTDAVGLGKDRDSVTRSGIILKALCGLGIAKEVGKKHGSNGRPAVVYEVQDPIVIPLGANSVPERESVEDSTPDLPERESSEEEAACVPELGHAVAEERSVVVEVEEQVPVAAATQGYYYDDDDDED